MQAQTDPNHPNIVFVLADDMGFAGLQAYGGNQIPSPNLYNLANNGIVCDNFRATPLSSTTRVCLMTGSYQQDRKSTSLNSRHAHISYAVFCLKKKKINIICI